MSKEACRRFFSGFGIVFAAFPLLILLLFYAYVIRARLAVGYWPSYSHPESWSMGFSRHYALLRPWFHVFPLALLPFVIALYDCALWAVFRKFPKWPFIGLGFSAIIVYAWRFTDPGKFIDWFLD
jgi:hypothetical protein